MAAEIRGRVISLSHKARTPHLGSSLSCVDILVSLYGGILKIDPTRPAAPDRDRCILSKGHAAPAQYAVLAKCGFFDDSVLSTYNQDGAVLAEHPGPGCVPGIEAATGSLGHGLPLGVGMALATRLRKFDTRVYVVMSDGECNEGSVWEAAMFAPAQRLETLAVIIDYNKWQATGRSDDVMSLAPLADKWKAFGWETEEVDGHDITALQQALDPALGTAGRPRAIVAHTVKGKGVAFMEDDNNWHYRIPTADDVKAAHIELGLK